jgi:hypothetical protein
MLERFVGARHHLLDLGLRNDDEHVQDRQVLLLQLALDQRILRQGQALDQDGLLVMAGHIPSASFRNPPLAAPQACTF